MLFFILPTQAIRMLIIASTHLQKEIVEGGRVGISVWTLALNEQLGLFFAIIDYYFRYE